MANAKSFLSRHARLLAVAVSCAGLGAGAGVIANAGAATSAASSTAHGASAPLVRLAARRWLYGGAVQGDLVVNTKSGFKTVSFERGFLDSVSGDTLTLREATRKATYKTVTVTVPEGALVRDRGHAATLSQLTPGEHVLVLQGPERTYVIARAG
jgi:hypothetical protein